MTKALGFILLLSAGCSSRADSVQPEKVAVAGLDNVHRLGDKIVSGSEPLGEESFRALSELGVRTILSVDGVRPDVELARKFGLRYVHLPFGYDGIPENRALSIARAARELPGPIYVHCHRGKHRGPAAAGIALIGLGACSPEQSAGFMRELGTSEHYSGLYRSVRDFHADPRAIEGADGSFPSVATTEPLVTTMAAVDRLWDRIGSRRSAGWKAESDRPARANDALSLSELFTEAGRVRSVGSPQDFLNRMIEAKEQASRLEEALRAGDSSGADSAYLLVQMSCSGCHKLFRDQASKGH